MKEMLDYYGFETIEEFGETYGFYNKTKAEKILKRKIEEDIFWD